MNQQLIAQLKEALSDSDVEIRLLNRKELLRTVRAGKQFSCLGFYNGENLIEIAAKGHTTANELAHTLLHELLHYIGIDGETEVSRLDKVAFRSRSLREAAKDRLLEVALRLP